MEELQAGKGKQRNLLQNAAAKITLEKSPGYD